MGLQAALERLVVLDREKNLISRDIVAIDLRLPTASRCGSRTPPRRPASMRLKDKPKKKGGDA